MALMSNEVIRKGELLPLGLWLLSWLCRDKQEGCLTPTLPPAWGKAGAWAWVFWLWATLLQVACVPRSCKNMK